MKNIKKIEHEIDKKTSRAYIIAGGICVAAIACVILFNVKFASTQDMVQNGNMEKTELTTAYVVKKEAVVQKKANKILIPVISEGGKVAKDSIVATYKGTEYENYEEKLKSMDKEILTLMKDLPTVYSSEVQTIENTIYSYLKDSIGETSYIKIQDYKQKVNASINKRATIIGNLSPEGAEIKTLIQNRNEYEASAKKSNDNILSPITGIVSYKTDGCEEKLSTDNVLDTSYDSIKETIVKNDYVNNGAYIKVVNNYSCYLVTKVKLDNLQYIKLNKTYNVRLIEDVNCEFSATIRKFEQKEDGVEVYFEITNGVEYLINLRDIEVEIVWWTDTGLLVKNEALTKYENTDAYYITVIKYGEYSKIPVIVEKQNDKYAIISNYSPEKLKELGLERKYTLALYDRIIIKSNR